MAPVFQEIESVPVLSQGQPRDCRSSVTETPAHQRHSRKKSDSRLTQVGLVTECSKQCSEHAKRIADAMRTQCERTAVAGQLPDICQTNQRAEPLQWGTGGAPVGGSR